MIQGVGNDIVEIKRIAYLREKHGSKFLNKVYTQSEQQYCESHREPARHYAGRWAAKEAVVKALGTGFGDAIGFNDIEIKKDSNGKPFISLSKSAKIKFCFPKFHLSISHSEHYATAIVIYTKPQKKRFFFF